ncbi:MAG: hypothetical protein QME62_02655 [Armatimonadota bacterium]|nr:hypothetical protein [Armatimonadota bacterium]
MAITNRTNKTHNWIWIILGIASILLILTFISAASSRTPKDIIVAGPKVKTGRPEDFIKKETQPPAPPPAEITPQPPQPETAQPQVPPQPEGEAAIPPGLPTSFTYQGKTWIATNGPISVNVITTGDYTDDHVIYRRQGDSPPYDALYIETAPNSGKFIKYLPQSD